MLMLAGILTCKAQVKKDSVWTAAYEADIYRKFYDQAKSVLTDEVIRSDFVKYLANRFKTELPNGLESITADSLTRMSYKFGKEYAFSHSIKPTDMIAQYTAWTPVTEQTIREGILLKWIQADLVNGNKYCDCYIRKLKILYPDKLLTPPPSDVMEKAGNECRAELRSAHGGTVWTAAYEAESSTSFDNELKKAVPDSVTRKALVTYAIGRFKTELPYGFESLSADSLTKLSQKIGNDFYASYPGEKAEVSTPPTPWTPAIEKEIRQGFLDVWPKKDVVNGNKYCDCYIKALKTKYPDKIPLPPPHDVMEKAAAECKGAIKKH